MPITLPEPWDKRTGSAGVRFLAIGLALAAAWAATTPVAASGQDGQPTQAIEQSPPVQCPDTLFRILPGAHDFCVARKDWQRGRYLAGIDMLKRSAAWGIKDAQLFLGVIYFNGDHVSANRPLGLAWLGLAAERKEARPMQLLKSAYGKATPAERQQAQRLMNAMWSTYGDQQAAVRADRHYQRALHVLTEREVYGDGICLAGITSAPIAGMNPAGSVGCPPIGQAVAMLDSIYANAMHGWNATVSVGSLRQATTVKDAEEPPQP